MALSKIKTNSIADNAITSTKIGVDVIVAEDLASNSITVAEIASGAVTTAKIADANVTTDKLATTLTVTHALGSASTPSITFTGDTNTGIFSPAADTLAFAEGGAEVARFDSSGNLGVGTDSPAFASGSGLEVQRSGDATVRVDRTGATNSAGEFVAASGLVKIGATSGSPFLFITDNTERMRIDSSGNVGIGTNSPTSGIKLDVVNSSANGTGAITTVRLNHPGTTAGDGPRLLFTAGASTTGGCAIAASGVALNSADMLFYAGGNTERMRINSSGVVLIGSTVAGEGYGNNNSGITIRSTGGASVFSNFSADYGLVLNKTTYQSGSTCYQINFRTLNQNVGGIFTDNSSTTYATTSDYRLKENVAPMTGALDKVAQLKPCTYTWKADGSDGQGFVAHEVQAIVPQAVIGEKDAVDENGNPVYQGVDTSFLVATLAAAIQELKAELDEYKRTHP